jgi:hypothetical protein
MSSIIFYTILMAAYIPFTFGQSTTTGLTPISEVVASVVASRSTTATLSVTASRSATVASSAAAASSAVTKPTISFDAVGTLTACQSTQ